MFKRIRLGIAVFALTAVSSVSAYAGAVGLYNTGVDASGNVLAGGNADPHWASSVGTNYVLSPSLGNYYSAWTPNGTTGSPGSAWIDPTTTNPTPTPPYTFTLTFSESGTISAITGTWYIDDDGTLSANGHLVDTEDDTFSGAAFTIPTTDLVTGTNTITVTMLSDDQVDDGMRVQFTNPTTSATPLPAALPLFAGGLGVVGVLAKRRKRKVVAMA
jgi:hypothetical protein